MALRLKTRSQDDTFALGRALGACLRPGDTLLLSGDLGTGKSVLARGAARAFCCAARRRTARAMWN